MNEENNDYNLVFEIDGKKFTVQELIKKIQKGQEIDYNKVPLFVRNSKEYIKQIIEVDPDIGLKIASQELQSDQEIKEYVEDVRLAKMFDRVTEEFNKKQQSLEK